MLQNISWAEYFSAMFVLAIIYYSVVIYRFFGFDFLLLFAARDTSLPTTQLSLFNERQIRDEVSSHPDQQVRSAAEHPSHSEDTEIVVMNEIEALLQNLSFFSPGEKDIVIDSVRDLLSRKEITRNYSTAEKQKIISEIIRLSESYCQVSLTEDEVRSLFPVKIQQ
jgi:hypothetical protein